MDNIKKVKGATQCEFFYKSQLIYGVYDTEFSVESMAFINGKTIIMEVRCQWLGGGIAEAESHYIIEVIKQIEGEK
jgi:hypothetical protein